MLEEYLQNIKQSSYSDHLYIVYFTLLMRHGLLEEERYCFTLASCIPAGALTLRLNYCKVEVIKFSPTVCPSSWHRATPPHIGIPVSINT